jgi:hypothetical protein
MRAAPGRKLLKTARARHGHATSNVQLDTRSQLQATPDRSFGWFDVPPPAGDSLAAIERGPNLVERPPNGLQRFDLQQAIEMSLPVVRPTADAEGSGQQTFLNVVPDRSARDVGEVGEVLYGVAGAFGHER